MVIPTNGGPPPPPPNPCTAPACINAKAEVADTPAVHWDQGHALAGLARCAHASGRSRDAVHGLRQAWEIFQRLGAAEATETAIELATLTTIPNATHPRDKALIDEP